MSTVTIHLQVQYDLPPPGYLVAVGPSKEFGSGNLADAPKMHIISPKGETPITWGLSVQVPLPPQDASGDDVADPHNINYGRIIYKYAAVISKDRIRYEAAQTKRYIPIMGLKEAAFATSTIPPTVLVEDTWRSPKQNVFISSAFTEAIFGQDGDASSAPEIITRSALKPGLSLADLKIEDDTWTCRNAASASATVDPHANQDHPQYNRIIPVRFVCVVPRIRASDAVFLTGSIDEFGAWDPQKKVPMKHLGNRLYSVVIGIPAYKLINIPKPQAHTAPPNTTTFTNTSTTVTDNEKDTDTTAATIAVDTATKNIADPAPPTIEKEKEDKPKPIEFKYAIYDVQDQLQFRERGQSRILKIIDSLLPQGVNTDSISTLNVDSSFHYNTTWKGAGVAVPVFSLKTNDSMGVGEFLDLKVLVDWALKTGMQMIQVLPINDTGFDKSPYSANSVFALHPIYVNIQRVATDVFGSRNNVPKEIQDEINLAMSELSKNKELDYQRTVGWKLDMLKKICSLVWPKIKDDPAFIKWFDTNSHWLPAYAAWKSIIEKTNEWVFTKWDLTIDDVPEIVKEGSEYYENVTLSYFTQYFAHVQLKEAADYACARKIALKGDLPIGVARYSADTWQHRKLFKMDWSAGAPGFPAQNWDFPLYNWEVMKKDNYAWWRARLGALSQYFQAYRIDHVLGFFRIWATPSHNYSGLHGRFVPCPLPVTKEEFKKAGITDLDRITKPYIKTWILESKLGSIWKEVAEECLINTEKDNWEFKPEYGTQAAVREQFPLWAEDFTPEQIAKNKKINDVLFMLIDNILADFDDQGFFYPTCHMKNTISYEHYGPPELRAKLDAIWQDYLWERGSWKKEGYERLDAMQSASKMMICAEDLGAVPQEAFDVLNDLGMLGLRIQRWGGWNVFGNPAKYPYLTVCAPSCHDCSTSRGWWEEDREACKRLYREFFGPHPPEHCEDWTSQKIVEQHLAGESMWTIIPIQDYMDMWGVLRTPNPRKDAINRPGESEGCWVYRMPIKIEDLINREDFNKFLHDMVIRTQRMMIY